MRFLVYFLFNEDFKYHVQFNIINYIILILLLIICFCTKHSRCLAQNGVYICHILNNNFTQKHEIKVFL